MSIYATIPGIGDPDSGDDPCVLLTPAQVRHLAEQLVAWADSTKGAHS